MAVGQDGGKRSGVVGLWVGDSEMGNVWYPWLQLEEEALSPWV